MKHGRRENFSLRFRLGLQDDAMQNLQAVRRVLMAAGSMGLCGLLNISAEAPRASIVFRGGMVVGGTGSPARRADVRVEKGRIAEVGGRIEPRAGAREIDIAGMIIAPGFIDTHGEPLKTPDFDNDLPRPGRIEPVR